MIVTPENFSLCLSQLKATKRIYVDTETTGLMWHQGNKPFSIIIANEVNEPWYFNLYDYGGTQPVVSSEILGALQEYVFSDRSIRLVAHNAKFDWHMLANLGFQIECQVYDTMSMHRFVNNKLFNYSLKALTGQKDDAAAEWIKKNPKIGKVVCPVTGDKVPAYWRVPFEIIVPYACQDVIALRNLYRSQIDYFNTLWGNEYPEAFRIELDATRTIWECERRGITLDTEYTLAAYKNEEKAVNEGTQEFQRLALTEFVDSGKALGEIFKERFGIELPKSKPSPITKKQEYKVDEETLLKQKGEGVTTFVSAILKIRKAQKKRSTYFENYLTLRNKKTGAIHTDFRQTGADTMRMSASAPNAQNVPDESEDEIQPKYPIRGCFIPRPGYKLVSIDFAAQEMRAALDSAGEIELAEKILGGEDVHQATADMMGVKRKPAKNIAFGIIYGSGAAKTASQIGCSVEEARRLRELYFSKLPRVQQLSKALMRMAEEFQYIVTRYGNRLYVEEGFAYKAVNYFIQGTCALHTKKAANKVREFLIPCKSAILLLIHDELLLEVHDSEMHIIPEIRRLMAEAYPHTILPQDTGVEIYKHRWGGETMD